MPIPTSWISRLLPCVSLPRLALGSFLNVVAARVPLRRSIVSPASACMSCGEEIGGTTTCRSFLCLASRPLPPLPGPDPARQSGQSSSHALLARRLRARVRADRRGRGRRVLLHRPRRRLGDRSRTSDHSQPHRPARRPWSCSSRTRRAISARSGRWPRLPVRASCLRRPCLSGRDGHGRREARPPDGRGPGTNGLGRPDARDAGRPGAERRAARAARLEGTQDGVPLGPFLAIGSVVALFWGHEILHAYFSTLR